MPERLRDWIVNHDDSWIFIILYVGLAVVLSLWISLFWLVVVVAGHFVLEWIRQRHLRETGVLAEVFWELKLDIALILFSLVLTLYLEVVFGILGLKAAGRAVTIARAGARGGSRFAAWERTLRGLLLSADDAAQIARALVVRRPSKAGVAGAAAAVAAAARASDGGQAEAGAHLQEAAAMRADARAEDHTAGKAGAARWGSWTGRWSKGDWFAVGLGVACVALILLAPWLTSHDYASAFATMGRELRPFPITVPLSGAP